MNYNFVVCCSYVLRFHLVSDCSRSNKHFRKNLGVLGFLGLTVRSLNSFVIFDPADSFTDEGITAKHTNGQPMERPLQVLISVRAC